MFASTGFFLVYLYTETGVRTFVSNFNSCISHYQLLQVCLLKLKALTNPFVLILFNTIFIITFMAQYLSCVWRGEGGREGSLLECGEEFFIFFHGDLSGHKVCKFYAMARASVSVSCWILTSRQPYRVTTQ